MPDIIDGFEAFKAAQAASKQKAGGVTDEQRRRVMESGEAAYKGNPLSLVPLGIQQAEANALAAIPRGITDAVTMVGSVPSMIKAGLSSEVDLPEAMMGKEGMERMQTYIQDTAQKEFDALPDDVKNPDTLKNLQQAVASSSGAENIRLENSNPLINYGTKAGNAINSAFGLNRASQESTTDDAEQILGAALVPTSGVSRAVGSTVRRYVGDSIAGRIASKTAELASDLTVPGTSDYTAKGIALNAGLQTGVNEGIRYATDSPSITTGDAFMTAQDVTTGQPEGEVALVPPPDADLDMGMGADNNIRDAAIAGSMTLGAVFAAGRVNKVAARAALDSIDEINTNHMSPKPDADEVLPSLSPSQQFKSEAIDETSPVRDTIYNVNRDLYYSSKQDIDRVMSDANSVNINATYENFLNTGAIDNLDRKMIPITKLEAGVKQLGPEGAEIFTRGMQAKRLLDMHKAKAQSLDDELMDAQIRGDQARLQAVLKQRQAVKDGTDTIGNGMTHAEATEAANALDNHKQASVMEAVHRQIQNDVLEASINAGFQTQKSVDKMKAASPNYMAMIEDKDHGVPWYSRLWRDEIKGKGVKDRPSMFNGVRSGAFHNVDITASRVEHALDPVTAAKETTYRLIAEMKRNEAIKTYVKTMELEPDSANIMKHVKTVTHDEFDSLGHSDMKRKENHIAYRDKDGIHYYEVGDPEVARAFMFDAPGTMFMANLSRKVKQSWTTGIFRPIFATTAMKMENSAIKTLRQPGRSTGMFDATLRRAFPDSKLLSSWLDKVGSNPVIDTFALQQLQGIFMMNSMTALKNMGEGIGQALTSDSAIARGIAQMAPDKLGELGQRMVRAANESRYYSALHHGALSGSLLSSPFDDIRADLHGISYAMNKVPVVKQVYNTYTALIDSMHNSGKYAFFAQNLAALERTHGGRVNIPPAEMKKLVHETRVASGDMTKMVGNKFLQKVQSAIPYGRIAVNATHALASAVVNDSDVRWRITTGAIMPKVMLVGAITAASPEVADWYWNDLPAWQRSGSVPMIGPDWWMDQASGKPRALTPNDIYLVREDPGISAISSSVVAALRSLGAFGDEPQSHAQFGKELKAAVGASVSVPLPPVLDMMLAGGTFDPTAFLVGDPTLTTPYETQVQGMNTEGMNADSDFTKGWVSFVNSLVGVGAANLVGSIDVGKQALEDGMGFTDAFKQAFAYGVFGGERASAETVGVRELGATMYTGGQRRMYAGTERRGRVTETFAKIEDIRKQLSAEKDTSHVNQKVEDMGYEGIQRIQDPQVRALAQEINKAFYSGKMKSLAGDRAARTKMIARLDASKEKVSPAKYSMDYNSVIKEMHSIDKQQEAFIDQFESRLHDQYGIDLDGAIGVINDSLGRQ